jgi:hypothetical protein
LAGGVLLFQSAVAKSAVGSSSRQEHGRIDSHKFSCIKLEVALQEFPFHLILIRIIFLIERNE